MTIAFERPDQPEVVALIEELDAYQRPLYPAESHHGIDIGELSAPHVLFAVARDEAGAAVGCGAIVLGAEFGELKRMFVKPERRGQGLASAILRALEQAARDRGCTLFTLETGYLQPEAIGLYARFGYEECGPFGSYQPDPNSVFMRKAVG